MTKPLIERAPCTTEDPMRIAVLVSGSGTNLQAIIDAAKRPGSRYRVEVVLSNRPMAKALERAEAAGIPEVTVDHKQFASRADFERAMLDKLEPYAPDAIVLAGFMRVLTDTFINAYDRRIVNVHPAILPAFPGTNASQQALDAGVRITGCTVHLVDAGVDTGPVLAQAAVPILEDDDLEHLQGRIQTQEHKLLPRVLDALADGSAVIGDDGRVLIRNLRTSADHLTFA
jgi:phosphoribosylglycinamide formyltransferase-1